MGLIPGLVRSLGGGHSNPLQYSCLGNPMDRGAWQATAYKVAKSWTQLKRLSTHAGGLLSRQLQQPLCQIASLCSSTSSIYFSILLCSHKGCTNLLAGFQLCLVNRDYWQEVRKRESKAKVFMLPSPALSCSTNQKSQLLSTGCFLCVLITSHSSEGPTPWPHLNSLSSSVPTVTVNFISTSL